MVKKDKRPERPKPKTVKSEPGQKGQPSAKPPTEQPEAMTKQTRNSLSETLERMRDEDIVTQIYEAYEKIYKANKELFEPEKNLLLGRHSYQRRWKLREKTREIKNTLDKKNATKEDVKHAIRLARNYEAERLRDYTELNIILWHLKHNKSVTSALEIVDKNTFENFFPRHSSSDKADWPSQVLEVLGWWKMLQEKLEDAPISKCSTRGRELIKDRAKAMEEAKNLVQDYQRQKEEGKIKPDLKEKLKESHSNLKKDFDDVLRLIAQLSFEIPRERGRSKSLNEVPGSWEEKSRSSSKASAFSF